MICGVVAVAFHLSIHACEELLFQRAINASGHSWMLWGVLSPTLGGLVAGIVLTTLVPGARGSGVPQVKEAYASAGGRVRLRDALGKFTLAVVQIGSGASLGREGPTVHICAGAANALARATSLPPRNMKRLTPVGVAAGIAAAFNAPIAAVTFTIEEIVGALDHSVLSGVVVAAAVAAVIERGVLGEHPIISVERAYGLDNPSSLLSYALLGLAAALASVAFTDALLKVRLAFRRQRVIPLWAQPAVGGAVTGAVAVVAVLLLRSGARDVGINGGGYATLSEALSGGLALRALLVLGALKLVATVASYSSGGVGGIFAPSLFIGAMVGGAMGYADVALFDHTDGTLGAFALVGMGAVFAGVIRAPITSVLIIFEMTGSYGLVLPLMVSNAIAYTAARKLRPTPIYEALLEQDGVVLPERGRRPHPLESLLVSDAMTSEILVGHRGQSVADIVSKFDEGGFALLPVVEDDGRVVGAVHARAVRGAIAGGRGGTRLDDLLEPVHCVSAESSLLAAVVRMSELGVRQLFVSAADTTRLVGVLAMTDLVRVQARSARPREDAAPDRWLGPPDEVVASSLFDAAAVVPAGTALHAVIDLALDSPAEGVVVELDAGFGVLLLDDIHALMRDEDLQRLLTAADAATAAPTVAPDASLPTLAMALTGADAHALVVLAADGRPVGVVTREAVAGALLSWYSRTIGSPEEG